jgi:hypothetical protein
MLNRRLAAALDFSLSGRRSACMCDGSPDGAPRGGG